MTAAPPAAAPSLAARLLGVVRAPRRTFHAIANRSKWADALVATFLITAASSAAVLATDVGRLALLDRWERTAIAFGRNVTDAQYAAMSEASRRGVAYAAGTSLVSGPLLAVAVSALLWKAMRPSPDRTVTYQQVLAIVAHGGVILALRQVVIAPIVYARETLASPLTLGSLVPGLEEASAAARFLSAFDLFLIWWIVVLALGMSVLFRRPAFRLALTFLGVYAVLAAIVAGAVALAGVAA